MNIIESKNKLYSNISQNINEEQKQIIDQLYEKIGTYYSKEKNHFGQSFLQESIDLSTIASTKIGLGFSALIAIIIFRAYENNHQTKNTITTLLPTTYQQQVTSILQGLTIVNKLNNKKVFGDLENKFEQKEAELNKRSKKFAQTIQEYLSEQGEYFKHFYISMGKDIRIILLKLSFHYYKILNIKELSVESRKITCREARYLYAPMAHQLGLYNIKTQLEETAMKYLNSDVYHYIAEVLSQTKDSRQKYIQNFIDPIKKSMTEINYQTSIKGRPKSIHSIWNKMQKQNVGLDKIYDLFAVRIILQNKFNSLQEEKSSCWNVYSKLTDIWTPNPKRLKDWISAPKASGYESLHTTVIGPEGKWVEVQIRTQRMDEIAEKGSAAHWKYKEIKGQKGHQEWIKSLQKLLENPEIKHNNNDIKNELYSDIMFVYTPAGELKKLQEGATVLDFAYKIHSKVGDSCTGAKINGKLVGIRHKITNGNIVEILTSKNQTPKTEWLDIITSRQAKTRINRALRILEKDNIQKGKEILLKTVENLKQKYKQKTLEFDDSKLNQLRKKCGYERINDFYLDITANKLNITEKYIYDELIKTSEKNYNTVIEKFKYHIPGKTESQKEKDYLLINNNMSQIKYEFAKCCNPIPGDDIFAFISANKGTKIHKINCPNARELFIKYPYRIMRAAWKNIEPNEKFRAKIKIISLQKPGIVEKISQIIVNMQHIELYDININETKNETYEGTIGIMLQDTNSLKELTRKLKQIKGIINITRCENT